MEEKVFFLDFSISPNPYKVKGPITIPQHISSLTDEGLLTDLAGILEELHERGKLARDFAARRILIETSDAYVWVFKEEYA